MRIKDKYISPFTDFGFKRPFGTEMNKDNFTRGGSDYIVKNGISLSRGVLLHPKQKYKCRECDKQFVLNPDKTISEEKKAIIDKLL
jgi:transposase-like protein